MLKTSAIFGDGMILQRNSVVAVFGETDCDQVEVQWCGETVCAQITGNKWIAKIKTGESADPFSMRIKGIKNFDNTVQETIEYRDILLGEVWMAGGQSNMELELKDSENGNTVAANADFDKIRFYNVPKCPMVDEELFTNEENTSWKPIKGEACRYMSAVAFYFATKLYSSLNVPIGVIDCYWGGTSATCWAEKEQFSGISQVQGYIEEWEEIYRNKTDEQYAKEMDEYNQALEKWQRIADEVQRINPNATSVDINLAAGPYPWPTPRGKASPFRPYGLHKSMVARIAPYTVRGFIYYQAEEDCDRGECYSSLNSAVIRQWREDFALDTDTEVKPFYITQLPMFISNDCQDDKKWCVLREQQKKCALENDNVGIAVICDCGEFDNIHPIDKKTPGWRLAKQVLYKTYDSADGLHNFEIADIEAFEDKCRLLFEGTYGRLHFRETDGKELTAKKEDILLENGEVNQKTLYGFEISNNGCDFYVPRIVVDGDTLILSGDKGKEITDVRYGWFNYGVVNLYSGRGIPLMPFWKKIAY